MFAYQDEAPVFEEETIPGGEGEFVGITLGPDYDGDGARLDPERSTTIPRIADHLGATDPNSIRHFGTT